GNAYLAFNQWHEFEVNSIGYPYDYGYVVVSTDMENWEEVYQVTGMSDGWERQEVDLSDYSGERIYVGFNAYSDWMNREEGWYIDDVALMDSPETNEVSIENQSTLDNLDNLFDVSLKENAGKIQLKDSEMDDNSRQKDAVNALNLP